MLCHSDYDDFYDDSFTKKFCSKCNDQEEKLEYAKEFMKGVISQLYSGKELNLLELEGDLDELCHYFGIKLIPGDLQIERLSRRQYVA